MRCAQRKKEALEMTVLEMTRVVRNHTLGRQFPAIVVVGIVFVLVVLLAPYFKVLHGDRGFRRPGASEPAIPSAPEGSSVGARTVHRQHYLGRWP
jgi:hypothetical protein